MSHNFRFTVTMRSHVTTRLARSNRMPTEQLEVLKVHDSCEILLHGQSEQSARIAIDYVSSSCPQL